MKVLTAAQHTALRYAKGGLNEYQGAAADALQPTLRFGFQVRLSASVASFQPEIFTSYH